MWPRHQNVDRPPCPGIGAVGFQGGPGALECRVQSKYTDTVHSTIFRTITTVEVDLLYNDMIQKTIVNYYWNTMCKICKSHLAYHV